MKIKVSDDACYIELSFHVQIEMENGKFLLSFLMKKPSLKRVQNFPHQFP